MEHGELKLHHQPAHCPAYRRVNGTEWHLKALHANVFARSSTGPWSRP